MQLITCSLDLHTHNKLVTFWVICGQFHPNINSPSSMLRYNQCYGLQPLLTVLTTTIITFLRNYTVLQEAASQMWHQYKTMISNVISAASSLQLVLILAKKNLYEVKVLMLFDFAQ